MNPIAKKNTGTAVRTPSWRYSLLTLVIPGLLFAGAALAGSTATEPTAVAARSPTATDYAFPRKADAAARNDVPSLRIPVAKLQVKSSSVMVIDAEDSSVLYSKRADVAMPIASITKLMTALVVLEGGQSMDEYI